jgi:hypothetical protein
MASSRYCRHFRFDGRQKLIFLDIISMRGEKIVRGSDENVAKIRRL